jgi:hypothetical protein
MVVVSEPSINIPRGQVLPANHVLSASRDRVSIQPFMEQPMLRGNTQEGRTLMASQQ